jgi:predicted FMN-binding regulatory protein PaiB
MHRLRHGVLVSFSHPSIFATEIPLLCRRPGGDAVLIRAVASNAANAAHHKLRQEQPGVQVAMNISIGEIMLAGANAGTEAT